MQFVNEVSGHDTDALVNDVATPSAKCCEADDGSVIVDAGDAILLDSTE